MKKALLILTALAAIACIGAMPFLCAHSNMLPEVSTAYYEYKAKEEALTATGPDAELMRMLTGLTADTKLEPVSTPLTFSTFGLILAFGVIVAGFMLFFGCKKQPDLIPALCWTAALAVPMGLISARLVYCLVNISYYLNAISAPEAMLKVWEGGLSLSGALAGAVLAGVIAAKLTRTAIGTVLDALAPSLLAFCFIVTFACENIGMGFGPEVGGDLGSFTVTIGETLRLNTSTLCSLAMIALLCVHLLHSLRLLVSGKPQPGLPFALTAFLYGTVMILLESLREDGHMVWGFVHAEMAFDLCFALPALLYLAKTKKRILTALLASAALAGSVVALEFALDRSAIGDGLLYALYIVVIGAYISLGCTCAKKRLAV